MASVSRRACILCIEDDGEMIELIRLILEQQGYEVLGATDGKRGIKLAVEESPDLILLDLMMPGMEGWEVYRALRENPLLSEVPVIVVTARAQKIDKALGLHIAKVDAYITKPFAPQELLENVEKVLARYGK